MEITVMAVGPNAANCYIVECAKKGIIIDPGSEGEAILDFVKTKGLEIEAIFNTHGHFDHIGANGIVAKATLAPIYIHEADGEMLTDGKKNLSSLVGLGDITGPPADYTLVGGESLKIAGLEINVLHTPGHSQGCISLRIEDSLFTGDTLFAGSVGRTDFPGSSQEAMFNSLRKMITDLPPRWLSPSIFII